MEKLILEGRGGTEISPSDLLTDEMIGIVEGLNNSLGKPSDPYYNETLNFKQETNSLRIVTIDADHVTSGKFDALDGDLINGEDDIFFKEPLDSSFNMKPELDSEFLDEFTPILNTFGFKKIEDAADAFLMAADPFMEREDGFIETKGFATPFGIEFISDKELKSMKKQK